MRQECGAADHEIETILRFARSSHSQIRRGGARDFPICYTQGRFMAQAAPLMVEEHVHGETVWVALRARGADWSWLTPEEAVQLGREWIERYAAIPQAAE
jgi:hypothetical protein